MEQWEYHILTAQTLDDLDELEGSLARLGDDSWELAGTSRRHSATSCPTARAAIGSRSRNVYVSPALVAAHLQAPQVVMGKVRIIAALFRSVRS